MHGIISPATKEKQTREHQRQGSPATERDWALCQMLTVSLCLRSSCCLCPSASLLRIELCIKKEMKSWPLKFSVWEVPNALLYQNAGLFPGTNLCWCWLVRLLCNCAGIGNNRVHYILVIDFTRTCWKLLAMWKFLHFFKVCPSPDISWLLYLTSWHLLFRILLYHSFEKFYFASWKKKIPNWW